jgi:hypothetical protein
VSGCTFTLVNDREICVRCSDVTLMFVEFDDEVVLPVVLVLAAPPLLLDALSVVFELPLVLLAAVPDFVPWVVPCAVPDVPEVPDEPDWALSVEVPPVVEVPEEPPVLLDAEPPDEVPLVEPDAPPEVVPEAPPDEPPGVMIVEPPEEPPEAPPELPPLELPLVCAIAATLKERAAAATLASKVTRIG